MTGDDVDPDGLSELYAIHRDIDREARRLADLHGERLQCRRGCSTCCLDDLTVTGIEASRIRVHHRTLLASGTPHPVGACAFLDEEGACRIYADRPSVCRSQGLPLRVLLENEEDEIEEHRDICPLNVEGGPALGDLEEDECWLIGPFELKVSELDRRTLGDDAPRVPLRGLFAAASDPRR